MKGNDTGSDVFLEEMPIKLYRKICAMATKIGRKDTTFYSTTEYFGKNPLRCTNLTYWVRDGCPDFCGQVNRKIPNGISVHFHNLYYPSLLNEIKKMGVNIPVDSRLQKIVCKENE